MITVSQDLKIQHASMNAFQSSDMRKEDLRSMLTRQCHVNTFTEMGQPDQIRDLNSVVRSMFGKMRVVNPDQGDIAFVLRPECSILSAGGEFVLPASGGRDKHGPRFVSWVTFRIKNEVITHHGVHFLTGWHESPARRRLVLKHANTLGTVMRRHAQGSKISTGSGDLNAEIQHAQPIRDVFDTNHITTLAQELDEHEGTHGNRQIDYIWTYDLDGRVSAKDLQVHKSPPVHTDHDPVTGIIHIDSRRG